MFRARFATVRPVLVLLLPLVILLALGSTTPAAAAPAPPTVAAGTSHSCARLSGGGLKCWGDNGFGQLGDGTTVQHLTPISVSGLSSGVAGVVAGDVHTCALTSAGGAKCWGDNSFGQLGNGTNTQSTTPSDVSGLASGVANIAAGTDHSCAITTAGAVKCWGYNGDGELGNGTTTDNPTPGTVSGLTSGVVAAAAGAYHACALTTAGAVKCWGYDGYGALGDGTTGDPSCACRKTPIGVSGLTSGVAAISAGALYTCALTTSGAVKCWGFNSSGQLGEGSNSTRLTPTPVVGLSGGVVALAAGYDHTCALMSAGGVKCWGYNSDGELGNGSTTATSTPVDVTGTSPDTDGDGVPDASDNCPNWPNPTQALPPWPIPSNDPDCDGFSTTAESFVGTYPTRHCSSTPAVNDEPLPDAWPVDFNDDQKVNTSDVLHYSPVFNTTQGGPPGLGGGSYAVRYDLNGDGKINTSDILHFAPFFNKSCSP